MKRVWGYPQKNWVLLQTEVRSTVGAPLSAISAWWPTIYHSNNSGWSRKPLNKLSAT